jgi:hypothetical protein
MPLSLWRFNRPSHSRQQPNEVDRLSAFSKFNLATCTLGDNAPRRRHPTTSTTYKRSGRFLVIAGGGKEPIEIGLRAQPYRDGDEFGDIVGVEFAQSQFDRGKKVSARLDNWLRPSSRTE